jgi:hypothetical protein
MMINTFVFVSFAGGCWGFISSLSIAWAFSSIFFLLIASASRQLFLSSPAHARPAFRSPRQHNNLIHIFDPAQQQHTLHFRISRRVGVSPPYSNPPVNSSCAQDTHTHTQHIRTYLKSPSTE